MSGLVELEQARSRLAMLSAGSRPEEIAATLECDTAAVASVTAGHRAIELIGAAARDAHLVHAALDVAAATMIAIVLRIEAAVAAPVVAILALEPHQRAATTDLRRRCEGSEGQTKSCE